MPYRVERRTGKVVEHLDKQNYWNPNLKRARIYSQLAHVKNSLGERFRLDGVFIVELSLQEVGSVPAREVMEPVVKARAERDAKSKADHEAWQLEQQRNTYEALKKKFEEK